MMEIIGQGVHVKHLTGTALGFENGPENRFVNPKDKDYREG